MEYITEMFDIISNQIGINKTQIQAVAELLEQGATIPFMARYRKEATGSLDEVAITGIRDAITRFKELEDRRRAILKSLGERELLTDDLKASVENAATYSELEDLYQKYRPKKRTRAMIAREKGLEPLAKLMMSLQAPENATLRDEAARFITPIDNNSKKAAPNCTDSPSHANEKLRVNSTEKALAGAEDIVAEILNEDVAMRRSMRHLFVKEALVSSRVKKDKDEQGIKYRDYFDWSEHAFNAPSHRVLAMLRGEREGVLTLHALPVEESALNRMEQLFITEKSNTSYSSPHGNKKTEPAHSPWYPHLQRAMKDSYKRLLGPAMENESVKAMKERADKAAIQVFTRNIQELLLSAPLGQKSTLAIDPGFRTGCKVVCLNRQGALLDHDVIFPMGTGTAAQKAASTILKFINKYHIEAIAIGNGTAGRETEEFIRNINLPSEIPVVMVDESGASIYSASQCARDEFPDHDITVRGAVSIGRRLMDPLAELVKIDPKSIGVGQYQHDVDQKKLHQALNDVVTTCVNRVGVELNTASRELLCQVAGLNRTTADNIVKYRDEHGPFTSRKALLKVPRLGPKAFEQCAGFLRIHQGKNPLDASGIHPESYGIVEKMALDLRAKVEDLMANPSLVNTIDLSCYVTESTGMPTLKDITAELLRPGRDPRESFKVFAFADHVHEISDLIPGMKLPGIITNVTAFGAFVDIGVHQDGLVHVSQMADHFVKNPADEVTVRQKVEVTVLNMDIKRKRISLSMKNNI